MCRRCGRAVWRTDAPQSRTAPPTVPRRMCSDTDPVRCSRRCRHACRVHGCRSNLNLCEANQSKAKQWEMCHGLSIPSIGSTHRPKPRCCQIGRERLRLGSLTLIAQDATPIRIADAFPGAAVAGTMLASRIDHALVAQRSTPARSASGWGEKRWWEKSREDKRVISFRIGKLLPAVVYIFPLSCHQIKLNSSRIAEIYRDWNPIGLFIKQSKIIRSLNFMDNILAIIYLSSCFFTSTVPCVRFKCFQLHLRASMMTMNQSSVS